MDIIHPAVLCWFSYEGDFDVLGYSIAMARRTFPGLPHVVLIDQKDRVVPRIDGVEVMFTSFRRGGNLNSPEAPEGATRALADAAAACGARAAMKIDCDCMVTGSSWAAGVLSGAADVAGWSRHTRFGYGAAYALSVEALAFVASSFGAIGPMSSAEDIEILGRARLWAFMNGRRCDICRLGTDNNTNTFRQYIPGMDLHGGDPAELWHCSQIRDRITPMRELLGGDPVEISVTQRGQVVP